MTNNPYNEAWTNGFNQAKSMTLNIMIDLGGVELKSLAYQLIPELSNPTSDITRFLAALYDQSLHDVELAETDDNERVYFICPTSQKEKDINIRRFHDVLTVTMAQIVLMEGGFNLFDAINSAIGGNPGLVSFLYYFYDYVIFSTCT